MKKCTNQTPCYFTLEKIWPKRKGGHRVLSGTKSHLVRLVSNLLLGRFASDWYQHVLEPPIRPPVPWEWTTASLRRPAYCWLSKGRLQPKSITPAPCGISSSCSWASPRPRLPSALKIMSVHQQYYVLAFVIPSSLSSISWVTTFGYMAFTSLLFGWYSSLGILPLLSSPGQWFFFSSAPYQVETSLLLFLTLGALLKKEQHYLLES